MKDTVRPMTFHERLDGYMRERGITHFPAREICDAGRRHTKPDGSVVHLQRAPDELWPNFVPTGHVLEWLRSKLGCPVYVTSGYRDPDYNAAVGGERNSIHLTFAAADIATGRHTPHEIADVLETHPDAHHFGIGVYPDRGFVHLDTRGLIGLRAPARW